MTTGRKLAGRDVDSHPPLPSVLTRAEARWSCHVAWGRIAGEERQLSWMSGACMSAGSWSWCKTWLWLEGWHRDVGAVTTVFAG